MELVSNFSERLKIAMDIKNMRARDIVAATKISKANISNYLSGRYEPKQINVYKIARFMNVNEAWLIGFDCEMERFNTKIDDLKTKIYQSIDDMNEEQLNKTYKFIEDYILK